VTTKIVSQDSPERRVGQEKGPVSFDGAPALNWDFESGRYWDRTSDLFGVNEALSR
jgi:hypothetical protein